jgi:DNA polymerase IV
MLGRFEAEAITGFCRDCLASPLAAPDAAARLRARCAVCGSPRLRFHAEWRDLTIAHIDCDAFYASVEKRDRPDLRHRAVIVGGGERGVVAAACYVARAAGVRSAMPMGQALRLCPEATVFPPTMSKYATVSRALRRRFLALTPLVEPLSLDEAFLDLTTPAHAAGVPAALLLANLAREVEANLGITLSIGLGANKLLAKIASDLDKPRGFALIGRAEAANFLAPRPVSVLWGVGKALAAALEREGIRTVGDLAAREPLWAARRFGQIGLRLSEFARGHDRRRITPDRPTKSIGAETTFRQDRTRVEDLSHALRPLAETVARRLQAADKLAAGVTVKLKSADFVQRTRSTSLPIPTQEAEDLWQACNALLRAETMSGGFRLIGLSCDRLIDAGEIAPLGLLAAPASAAQE